MQYLSHAARNYHHIDLRFARLEEVRGSCETHLPALGFTRKFELKGWLQFESADGDISEFFGITESPAHIPNENRVAFWAADIAEAVRPVATERHESP